jgi:hypothetical protein
MKILIALGLILCICEVHGQNGFIRFSRDSIIRGYIKYYISPKNREEQLEFWKTKNDKSPVRISKRDIDEYAIGKDTFRILENFRPFDSEEFYFDVIDAKIIQSGKIELLSMVNPFYQSNAMPLPVPVGNTVILVTFTDSALNNLKTIKVLHNRKTGFIKGVPPEGKSFEDVIADFFSEAALKSYVTTTGKKIRYKDLQALVKFYNGKTRAKNQSH